MSHRTALQHLSHLPRRSLPLARSYASISPTQPPLSTAPYQVFDRSAKRAQKDRAATRLGEVDADGIGGLRGGRSRVVDYLRGEVAERVAERFEDLRVAPADILDLSAGSGQLSKLLSRLETTKSIHMLDMSVKTLWRDPDSEFDIVPKRSVIDEEELLHHIPENSQDCIVSSLGLHWVNDLPGVLTQIRRALKPDGVFIGCMLGGDTLFELRTALQLAEQEREGGISPRVSPMADPKDASNLLQRAGFTLLTVDLEDLTIAYPSMWELMEDLRDMGESGAVLGRRGMIKRDVLIAAEAIYKELHGQEDGSVPATFSLIFLIGWKPSPNQPKPLPRGSGKTSLKDVL